MKVKQKRRTLSYERKKSLFGYSFLLPWLIGSLGLFLRSFISAIVYSFSKLEFSTSGILLENIGCENYKKAFFFDPDYVPLLVEQIEKMLINVPLILIFSLFFAVLLNQNFKGRAFTRAVFFLPVIIGSGIVITIIQGDTMSNDVLNGTRASGFFESMSLFTVLEESGFGGELVDQMITIVSNIFSLAWHSGLQIILFLAALQTVPDQLYEVAKVEGATSWEVFFKITFPMITPIIIVNLIYTLVDSFTDYGNELLRYILRLSNRLEISYSSALSMVYFIIIFVIIIVVLLILDKSITYVEK